MKETIEKIKEENIKGIYGTLKELFKGKEKALILAALGTKQEFIVAENEEAVYRAIEVAKKEGRGRVTFIPLNNIKTAPGKLLKPEIGGILDYAINIIEFDEKYKDAFYFALGETLIVQDNEAAKNIINKYPNQYRMATLDGIIHEKDGRIIHCPIIKEAENA